MYIYNRLDWPRFHWNEEEFKHNLVELRYRQGLLMGGMAAFGFKMREDAIVQAFMQDILKTSEIEGEILDQDQVRSSISQKLGIDSAALDRIDKKVEGVVTMMLDATLNYDKPLTKERLLEWHKALFPGTQRIIVGAWRKKSVRVVSGQIGDERIHFEGPSAEKVDAEMQSYIYWINEENDLDPILKAAIAHLWFVTIHPFDDGNGRIGRAVADLLLARSEQSPYRFYSLSAQIQKERRKYYKILEQTQKGPLEITPWIVWFITCLRNAIDAALSALQVIIDKKHFWESIASIPLNERQKRVINRMLEGFEGKLNTSKWAKMARCSQDTAYRDILDLVGKKILIKNSSGGRSTSYSLIIRSNSLSDKFT